MIVEDQPLTVEYLEKLIPWDDLGFPIIARSGNGREALDLLDQFRPDIILADVEMPVLNGLDFSRQALKQYPWTQILVISSHRQFDYVKEAINFGATDYILKHEIVEDSLVTLLKKCRKEIESHLEGFASTLNHYYEEEQLGYIEPLGSAYFRKDDLWIYASPGSFPVSSPVPALTREAVFPELLGMFRLALSFPLRKTGFLAFYRPGKREGTAGFVNNGPDREELVHDLRKQFKGSVLNGCIYMVDLVTGSRYWLNAVFDTINKLEQFRSILSPSIVLHGDLLDRLIRERQNDSGNILKNSGSLVTRAVEFIQNNYMHPIGTGDVADGIGVSTAYLCQKFKEERGETILKALTKIRIERAKELLEEGYIHINDISEACGFTSPRYFSQVFRKATGKTPTDFREGDVHDSTGTTDL